MRDRDYYPAGAYDDPSAPYNQCGQPDKDFGVTCSQTLSKEVTVTTNKYTFECDYDEDGYWEHTDTSDICWADEYHDNGYHTPLELLQLFKEFLEEQKSHGVIFKTPHFTNKLIEELDDWQEDETEYIED